VRAVLPSLEAVRAELEAAPLAGEAPAEDEAAHDGEAPLSA